MLTIATVRRKAILATAIFALLFLAAAGALSVYAAENSWVEKAPMPTARFSFGVAVTNGKIYAIGGAVATQSGKLTAANEEYDPTTNTWTEKTPMPTARYGCAVVAYENKIYVFGGAKINNSYTNKTEVYDPTTNTWTTKASMPTARILLQANVVNGKIYLIGGYDNQTLNEVYDPTTDSWTTETPIPTGVVAYASAVVDNKIYVIGGVFTNLTQIYDPKTDTWSLGAPIPTPVSGAGGGAIPDESASKAIYVVGGETDIFSPQNLTQIYFPENNSWSTGTSLPTVRSRLCAAVVDNMLYAIGGTRAAIHQGLTDNEQYTPIGYATTPEFPPALISPLFMMMAVLAAIIYRRRASTK
jgi:N-acetylneuraminic acid mutarotase